MAEGTCGLHLCGKCALVTLIFGLLLLLSKDAFNYIPVGAWVVLGFYMLLLGLYSMMMKK